jgi:hypothetical protein
MERRRPEVRADLAAISAKLKMKTDDLLRHFFAK